MVPSFPDWGVTPFGHPDATNIGREIGRLNEAVRSGVGLAGAAWVDITPASQEPHPDWEAPDGLSPSGAQYSA